MPPEDDTTLADAAREEAELGAGFDAEPETKPAKVEKTEPPAPEPATAPAAREPKPEYVRLTKAELAELKDAAAKSASHDRQYATAWGKIGNLTTMVNELRAGGGPKLDLSSAAFAKLKDQFPELAEMTREAVQNAIAGRDRRRQARKQVRRARQQAGDRQPGRRLSGLARDRRRRRHHQDATGRRQPVPQMARDQGCHLSGAHQRHRVGRRDRARDQPVSPGDKDRCPATERTRRRAPGTNSRRGAAAGRRRRAGSGQHRRSGVGSGLQFINAIIHFPISGTD